MLPRRSTLNHHQCILHPQRECESFLIHFVLHELAGKESSINGHAFMALKAAIRVKAMNPCTHTYSFPQVLSVEVKLMHCVKEIE